MPDPNDTRRRPGPDKATMFVREDADIEKYGFHYTLVFGDDRRPGFLYTSGLAEQGLPEFIFIGSSQPQSTMYLATFIDFARSGGETPLGLVMPSGPDGPNAFEVPAWVAEMPERLRTHAFGVEARLRRIGSAATPRILQVIMPDLDGRFPWEPGYAWLDQLVAERPS